MYVTPSTFGSQEKFCFSFKATSKIHIRYLKKIIYQYIVLTIIFVVVLGYVAWRDEKLGSWFFCDLISVFEKYYERKHLEEIMINLKRKIAERTHGTSKQMACTWSTLTKQVYLNKLDWIVYQYFMMILLNWSTSVTVLYTVVLDLIKRYENMYA